MPPEVMVAMAGVVECHVPPAAPGTTASVLPRHTDSDPDGVKVVPGITVIVCSPDEEQPPPETICEMVVEPGEIPVTMPELLTVAIEALEEAHVPPGNVLERAVVPDRQTIDDPDTVGAAGGAATVTVKVAKALLARV